jgi:hypothetical protein
MIFNCLWDNTVIIITLVVSVLLLAVIISLIKKISMYRKNGKNILFLILLSVICLLPFLSIFYLPLSIETDNKNLYVNKIIGNIAIPINSIEDVRICTNETSNSVKFGSGGFFGYLGIFKNDILGSYYMYATDLSNRVVLKTSGKTYVISCETPQRLIDIITVH